MNISEFKNKGSHGTFFDEENPSQMLFCMKSGKAVCNLIFGFAVELHENNAKYDRTKRNLTIGEMDRQFPELEKYPELKKTYLACLDRICQKKEAMGDVLYQQALEILKKKNVKSQELKKI